jgi:hypothetical protein
MPEIRNEPLKPRKHTLKLDGYLIYLTGIVNVESVSGKEAVILLDGQKLIVRGVGLSVYKLDITEGNVVLEFKQLYSINYTGHTREKFSLKGLFK